MMTAILAIVGFHGKSGAGGDPPRDKGKGRVLVLEAGLGEVAGVICDLCRRESLAGGAR